MVVTDWAYSIAFDKVFWILMGRIELNNIKFYKRTFTLIFDCFKPFYNGFGIAPLVHLCLFSDFAVDKFKIVFAKYSYFRLGRVNKPTFRIVLEIYFVIFNGHKGFALVELFYSIVEFKLSCDDFCFLVDVVNDTDVRFFARFCDIVLQ